HPARICSGAGATGQTWRAGDEMPRAAHLTGEPGGDSAAVAGPQGAAGAASRADTQRPPSRGRPSPEAGLPGVVSGPSLAPGLAAHAGREVVISAAEIIYGAVRMSATNGRPSRPTPQTR